MDSANHRRWVPERPISANRGLKFCSVFVFYLPMYCLQKHFVLSLLYLGVKAQQHFVSSSCTFLDEKTLLKTWLNPGLNLTIFQGTLVERRRLPRFPAKMTLVHARALLSILRANYYPVDTYVTEIRHAVQ